MADAHPEAGSAAVDFVLVMVLLVPLVLGIAQVALVLHVRNTATAAASDGARVAASLGSTLQVGESRARQLLAGTLADRFVDGVNADYETVAGAPGVRVHIVEDVPPLGLLGPSIRVAVDGHAVREVTP